jgi:hypothetical protein
MYQTTKDGNFRGSNHFQHDVDVVIQILEKGVSTKTEDLISVWGWI